MSTVNGTFSVNVEFRDTTTSSGVQSLKTLALRETTEYTTGKVAILTGTAGTAAVTFTTYGQTSYRNSSGSLVSFAEVSRIAFSWSGTSDRVLTEANDSQFLLRSKNGNASVSNVAQFQIRPEILPGDSTGTFTIILYGT